MLDKEALRRAAVAAGNPLVTDSETGTVDPLKAKAAQATMEETEGKDRRQLSAYWAGLRKPLPGRN